MLIYITYIFFIYIYTSICLNILNTMLVIIYILNENNIKVEGHFEFYAKKRD